MKNNENFQKESENTLNNYYSSKPSKYEHELSNKMNYKANCKGHDYQR